MQEKKLYCFSKEGQLAIVKKIIPISLFGMESAKDNIRDKARKWVAKIGMRISRYTGKPIYKSLIYKGVNAWWFIEINLHEPAFLSLREKSALKKASEKFKAKIFIKDKKVYLEPNILLTLEYEKVTSLRKRILLPIKALPQKIKSYIRRISISIVLNFQLFLFKLKHKEILAIIEEENLRRYFDLKTKKKFTSLPYAEGILEKLREYIGKDLGVLSRKKLYSTDWPFLKASLPILLPEDLPVEFNNIIEEVYEAIKPVIGKYIDVNTLKEIMRFRLAEFNLYLKLLKCIKPKVLFVYNWEGVFRPLMAAARKLGCAIVGIQQALGPYQHALNHEEVGYWTKTNNNYLGFPVPDKYLIWSEFHKRNIISYGYDEKSLEIAGYPRLDRHFKVAVSKEITRENIANALGLDPNGKYLLLTAQHSVLDTHLVSKENYKKTLDILLRLSSDFGFKIIMKPWAGDDMDFLTKLASNEPERIYIAPQNLLLHNAELISLTDWCVGTFSSIMGECVLLDNACFLLNYPESRYYFEPQYMEVYRDFAIFIDSPDQLEEALLPALSSEEERRKIVQSAKKRLSYIFGKCDGKSAERCARIILEQLKKWK